MKRWKEGKNGEDGKRQEVDFLSWVFGKREGKLEGSKVNLNFPCLVDENMKGKNFLYYY